MSADKELTQGASSAPATRLHEVDAPESGRPRLDAKTGAQF
jgi:hypothetical protein